MRIMHVENTVSRSDDELLAAFRLTGEQQVLATLYLRYADLIYGVCFKYLQDAEASKDAVMNIYQELLIKLPNHEVDNFKGWVYVVAKNHCLTQLRKEKKNITVSFDTALMQSEDFSHLDSVLDKEQDFKKLEVCLETLSEAQKQAVQLFYLQNKCYNEITGITGNDWNKVRSLIQNGRRNLKNCMESDG